MVLNYVYTYVNVWDKSLIKNVVDFKKRHLRHENYKVGLNRLNLKSFDYKGNCLEPIEDIGADFYRDRTSLKCH